MTADELYQDMLRFLTPAQTEENMLAALNGGIQGALLSIRSEASITDPAIRQELIDFQLDYILATLKAYTQLRLGHTYDVSEVQHL